MVTYRRPRIELWLQAYGVELIETADQELLIDAPQRERQTLLKELSNPRDSSVYLKPAEREQLLTFLLMTHAEPVLVQSLANRLNVSRSTILTDLAGVEQMLGTFGLKLLRRRNYGLKVTGPERSLRRAIREMLYEVIGESNLIRLCRGEECAPDRYLATIMVDTYVSRLRLPYAFQLVQLAERSYGHAFVDFSRLYLSLYLAVMLHRVATGHVVDAQESFETGEASQTALILQDDIRQRLNITLPSSEVTLLAVQLLSGEVATSSHEGYERLAQLPMNLEVDLFEIQEELLVSLSRNLHPCLHVDKQLRHDMLLQLSLALSRSQMAHRERNPYLGQLRSRYQHVLRAVDQAIVQFGEAIPTLSEDEQGYLAMLVVSAIERLRVQKLYRVVVACSAGLAGARLLTARLHSRLPELEVVDIVSALDLKKSAGALAAIDAIISTVPLRDEFDVPVLVISPFLKREEIESIRQFFCLPPDETPESPTDSELLPGLAELLTEDVVAVNVAADNWQAVVDLSCKPLIARAAIETEYVTAIRELLGEYGPYMVLWPHVVLLHAHPEDGARDLGISMMTLEEPVAFGPLPEHQVLVASTLSTTDTRSHLRLLDDLRQVFSHPAFLEGAQAVETGEGLLNLVNSLMAS